jgi:hypothetical protein
MPISAQYTWNEKKELIKVCIPLKGISPAKVDIIGRVMRGNSHYNHFIRLVCILLCSLIINVMLFDDTMQFPHRQSR